jgi:hypothetical protein
VTGRQPTRDDHDRFCVVEGWSEVRNARGKPVRHHKRYELTLPDGAVLRTRISRPVNRTTYGPAMWRHILTEQLQVSQDEFWACVDDGQLPRRGAPDLTDASLPASLVYQLLHDVGLSEEEITRLTRAEAIARMQAHWSRPQ